MRKILSMLTTAALAAGLSLATATPAAAAEYCFGAPSEPLAYVCVGVVEPTVGPLFTWGEPQPVTIRSLCYGVGCTEETTVLDVSLPTGTGEGVGWPSVTITWNGHSVPGDDLEALLYEVAGIVTRIISRYIYLGDPICTETMCL